jgi:hypothetical protein
VGIYLVLKSNPEVARLVLRGSRITGSENVASVSARRHTEIQLFRLDALEIRNPDDFDNVTFTLADLSEPLRLCL